MGCNTCHSSCGDCSEGGISFKRQLSAAALAPKPATRTATDQAQPLLPPDQQHPTQREVAQVQGAAS